MRLGKIVLVMKNIYRLRKIAKVFGFYGILLTGPRKYDHFYHDLQMDKIYVAGLIFELELELERELESEVLDKVKAPVEVIRLLMDA